MKINLTPEVQKMIQDRVKSRQYRTAEDVVTAAIFSLRQQEEFGDFEPGELDALIEEGEKDIAAGRVIPGEEVFAELRRRYDRRVRNSRNDGK